MKDFRRRFSSVNRADRHDWYRISNSAGDTARVEIYDFIDYDPWWDEGVDAKKLARRRRRPSAVPRYDQLVVTKRRTPAQAVEPVVATAGLRAQGGGVGQLHLTRGEVNTAGSRPTAGSDRPNIAAASGVRRVQTRRPPSRTSASSVLDRTISSVGSTDQHRHPAAPRPILGA
jgi:hypothetical protein